MSPCCVNIVEHTTPHHVNSLGKECLFQLGGPFRGGTLVHSGANHILIWGAYVSIPDGGLLFWGRGGHDCPFLLRRRGGSQNIQSESVLVEIP